jgi:hypothetical protein
VEDEKTQRSFVKKALWQVLLHVNIFIFEQEREKNEIEKFSRWGIAVDVVYRSFNDLNLYQSLNSSNKLKN